MNRTMMFLSVLVAGQVVCGDVSVRRRAVDVIQLTNGTRLFGVMLPETDQNHLRLMMRREWMQQNASRIHAIAMQSPLAAAAPNSAADGGRAQLLQHIEQLRGNPADGTLERMTFLQERLELFPEQKADTPPDLIVVQIPSRLIRQKLLKPPRQRQIAGVALLNNLSTAETSSSQDLAQELAKIPAPAVIRELPQPSVNNDQVLVDGILLQADRTFGKTTKLIHHEGQYFSESNPGNLQLLATRMISGQIQSQVQQLLGPEFQGPGNVPKPAAKRDQLSAAAVKIADQEDADLVEVTSMKLDVVNSRVTVDIDLFRRDPGSQKWQRAIAVSEMAGRADVTDESQQRIANDPSVRQITDLFAGLGVGGQDIGKAISIGSVVEVAQQRAKTKLADAVLPAGPAGAAQLRIMEAKLTAEALRAAAPSPEQPAAK